MSINVGTAIAYLELETSGFNSALGTAQSALSSTASSFTGALDNIGGSMTSIGNTMTRTLTLPIVGLGTAATKVTADFDTSMSKVQALSGATTEELEVLRAKAIEMGSSTKFSATEAADAFSYMALAGWDTQKMISGIPGILNLAAASQMDLATASDMVTDYLTAFGWEAERAGEMADMLSYAQANSNTTTVQLGDAFGNCAAYMHTAGQTMYDVTSILEAMANQGTKGSEAGTALSAVMRDIVQNMEDGAISINGVAIAVQDEEGNFRSLIDIMADVEKATAGLGTADKTNALAAVFTSRSIKAVGEVLTETTDSIYDYRDALYGASGTAEEQASIMLDNINGALTLLKSNLESLMIRLGDAMVPTIIKLAEGIGKLVDKLNEMSDEEVAALVQAALVIAALGPILSTLGKLITTISSVIKIVSSLGTAWQTIVSIFKTVSTAISSAGIALSTIVKIVSGVGAIIAGAILFFTNFISMLKDGFDWIKEALMILGIAIAAVGAIIIAGFNWWIVIIAALVAAIATAAVLIKEHWDEIKEWFENTWESIKEFAENAWNAIVEFAKNAWDKVKEITQKWYEFQVDLLKKIIEGIKNAWEKIKELLNNAWEHIVSIFENIKNLAIEFLTSLWNNIKEGLANIWNILTTFFENTWEKIKEAFDKIKNMVSTFFNNAKDFLTNLFNSLRETIGNLINSLVEKIQEVYDKVVGAVQNLLDTIGSLVNGFIQVIKDIFNGIENVLNQMINYISDLCQGIINVIGDIVTKFTTTVTSIWGNLANAIKETFENIYEKATEGVSNIIKKIEDVIPKALEAGKKFVLSFWDGIQKGFEDLTKWFKEKIAFLQNLISGANFFSNIGSTVTGWFNGSHANGLDYVPFNGYVAQLHEGERVLTKSENKNYSNESPSNNTTVNIYSYEKLDEYEAAKQMKKALRTMDLGF